MSSRWLFLASTILIAMFALFSLWHSLTPPVAKAGHAVVYVSLTGCNNRAAPCYDNLQTAVSSVSPHTEIRIAQGVYTQVQTFMWSGELITQVAFITKPLTLRGGYDINNWDTPFVTQTTVLSAGHQGRVFAILGNADSKWQVELNNIVVAHGQTFTHTNANWGGGIWVNNAHLQVTHSDIISNYAAGPGGGIAVQNGMLTLTHNFVAYNQSGDDDFAGGGGVQLASDTSQSAFIYNNQFMNNQTAGFGGAIGVTNDEPVTIISNTLTHNSANMGGAIFAHTTDAVHIQENIIEHNHAYEGGGIGFVMATGSIEQNFIRFNQAMTSVLSSTVLQGRGGGLSLHGVPSTLPLVNNIIADNLAEQHGGAIYLESAVSVAGLHNTVARNQGLSGIAVGSDGTCLTVCHTLALTNTILVSHSIGITVMDSSVDLFTNHTLWHQTPITIGQAMTETPVTSAQNIVADPLFLADGYHITSTSPAVNTGAGTSVMIDIDGEQRPLAAPADIGADETFAYLRYVAPSANCGGMLPCYEDIQTAVDDALAGDEIRVANGTYDQLYERLARSGEDWLIDQVVHISKNLTIQGGYSTTNWIAPDPTTNVSIIDAQQQGRGIYIYGEQVVHIAGFQVLNGLIDTEIDAPEGKDGGGIYAGLSTLTLDQVDLYNNHAPLGYGGGIATRGALSYTASAIAYNTATYGGGLSLHSGGMGVTLYNNTIHHNEANEGGGLWGHMVTDVHLQQNDIEANVAYWGGGIAFISAPSPITIAQNYILNNEAVYTNTLSYSGDGGAIALRDTRPRFENNIIAENIAEMGGSAFSLEGSAYPHLIHNTIANNEGVAGVQMGDCIDVCAGIAMTNTVFSEHAIGIYMTDGESEVYINAHLWGQVPITISTHVSASVDIVNMSLVETAVAYLSPDYHLTELSPAIDSGIYLFNDVVRVDIDGDFRPAFLRVDLGADEFSEDIVLRNSLFLPIVRAPFD